MAANKQSWASRVFGVVVVFIGIFAGRAVVDYLDPFGRNMTREGIVRGKWLDGKNRVT